MNSTFSSLWILVEGGMANRLLIFTTTLLLIVGCTFDARAAEFGTPVSYPVGSSPSAIVTGDFNGDGRVDIAVCNSATGNVSVLLSNGDGTFQASITSAAGSFTKPTALAAGDFNGDGKLDLVVVNSGTVGQVPGSVTLLLGNGNGTFQTPAALMAGQYPYSVTVGDLNGDHKPDIVVGDQSDEGLTVFLTKSDGTLQPQPTIFLGAGGTITSVVGADFNNDGKLDLVASVASGPVILLGNGDGSLQTPLHIADDAYIGWFLIGDFDHDGKTDFIVQGTPPRPSGCHLVCIALPQLHFYKGAGDGTFQLSLAQTNFASGGVAGDFNVDGKLDLFFTGNRPSGALSNALLLGQGAGTFQAVPEVVSAPFGRIVAADFNGDGLLDIAITDSNGDAVVVALNESPTSGADLALINTKAPPDPSGVGINFTYTTTVVNEGPKDATIVTFKDILPSGSAFVSATSTQGTCSQSGNVVICDIGSLASAFGAILTIVVTPETAGANTNSMEVSSNESDLAISNNSATQTTTVVPVYTLTVGISGDPNSNVISSTSGVDGGGISCPGTCSSRYLAGTVVYLNTNQWATAIFSAWGGACTGTNPSSQCALMMDSDNSVSATFITGVILNVALAGDGSGTVTINPGGTQCADAGGSCQSAAVLAGTTLSLIASPSSNSTFANWSGACSGTDPGHCTVTLNASSTVTATFNLPADFTVSADTSIIALSAGTQSTDVLSFGAQGGFSSQIALSCSVTGPAPLVGCGITPSSVAPGAKATLTITAPKLLAAAMVPTGPEGTVSYFATILGLLMAGLCCITGEPKGRKRPCSILLTAFICVVMLSLTACGGSSSPPPPPPRNYTVTVTAVSGTTQHLTSVSVTVQ